MYPKKCNKLALCQISQIVRVWVMKGRVSKYCEHPSVFSFHQIPSLFRQIRSRRSYSEPILEMEDFSGDGKRSVWNGWDLKFYVNSCVKMSSAHVAPVTCGIFPCEPNLYWRVTISKFWSFRPRVILSFMGLAVKDGLRFLSCSDDFLWTQPKLKGESLRVSSSGFKVQLKCMWCSAVHLSNPSI